MGSLEQAIKSYFENLDPKILDEEIIEVKSVSKLGSGTSNLNYLVITKKNKLIFRFNTDKTNQEKSKKEFDALKIVEKLNISPKAFFYDDTTKFFDNDFLVIEYIEGESLDKIDYVLDEKLLTKLARLLSKIHSIKINRALQKLSVNTSDFSGKFNDIKSEFEIIKKYILDKDFIKIIDDALENLKAKIDLEKKFEKVLSQNDFCEQNIIFHKGEYKLIDFESLGLTSAEAEISSIFTEFGREFDENQRDIFLHEYCKRAGKNVDDFKEAFLTFRPLNLIHAFLWAVAHIKRIQNGEFSEEFVISNDIEEDKKYAIKTFERCLESGIIDQKYKNFNLYKVVTNNKV